MSAIRRKAVMKGMGVMSASDPNWTQGVVSTANAKKQNCGIGHSGNQRSDLESLSRSGCS
jgi:hypothetical protein